MAIRLLFLLVSAVCLAQCMGQNQKIERDADNSEMAKIATSDDFLDILTSKAVRSVEKRGIDTEFSGMGGINVEKDNLKKRLDLEKRWFGSRFRVRLPQIRVPPVVRHIVRRVRKAAGKVVKDVVKEVGGAAKHVLEDVGKLGEAAGKVAGRLGKTAGGVVEDVVEAATDVAEDVEELVEAAEDVVEDLSEAALDVALDAIEAFAECASDIVMDDDSDRKKKCELRNKEGDPHATILTTPEIADTEAKESPEKRDVQGIDTADSEGNGTEMEQRKREAVNKRFITGFTDALIAAAVAGAADEIFSG